MPVLNFDALPPRTNPGALADWIAEKADIERRRLGKIDIRGPQATVEIPSGWENRLARALDGESFNGRRLRVWRPAEPTAGGEDHFARLARLLDLESQAEASRAVERGRRLSAAEAERSGNSLVDLLVADEDAGLGGRYLLKLVKRHRGPLPWTRLGVGAPVVLSPHGAGAGQGARGVVYERGSSYLRMALTRLPDDLADHELWRLDASYDEIATARQREALGRAGAARTDRLAELRQALMGERPPGFQSLVAIQPLDGGLNAIQREAIELALSARDVALLQGPPGTGKTTAVVELIRQAVRRGDKVLACAPSNLAVDNIFERLLAAGARAVRLGHPARVLPALRDHTLDLLVAEHPDVKLARKLVKEALALFRKADRHTRARPEPGARRESRQEAKALLADARRLEAKAVDHVLDTADVLCATTTALDAELLAARRFQLGVIDEACQSTEPGCWIPLLRCERVVLAGDHCQLPPTVLSPEAVAAGYGVSLFERLMALDGPRISRRLSVQYRMHASIAEFSSREFYDSALVADPSVAGHLLSDLAGVTDCPLTQTPLEFIDTAGASYDEALEPDGESRMNPGEADLVLRKVQELIDCGVPAADVAVITPYAAQARLLREKLSLPDLEIDSVDGFQGREKEAIVLSLVRSNPKGEIGFLADVRRMNVALTRARRKLLIVGDSATLSAHPFYQRLLEHVESAGAYRTVWEEM